MLNDINLPTEISLKHFYSPYEIIIDFVLITAIAINSI